MSRRKQRSAFDQVSEFVGTTDYPTQCTTSRKDRQILRMAVTDRSVTSRTVARHIEAITYHSVSARIIRRRLQPSSPLCTVTLVRHRCHSREYKNYENLMISKIPGSQFPGKETLIMTYHPLIPDVYELRELYCRPSAPLYGNSVPGG
ncbi:transposable element Tcb1 transposase [Trichonephila clavipes]|nr:transposable element Tcb1 transposase [Trichonephila clavipes]